MRTNEDLAMLAKQGDREATAQLWEQTKKLVFKYLSHYFKIGKKCGFDVDDMLQIGFFGFIRAIKYYDPEKGYAFNSYLPLNVNGAIRTELKIKHNKELPPFTLSLDEQIAGEKDPIFLVDAMEDNAATHDMEQVEINLYLSQLREVLRPGLDALDERGREVMNDRICKGESYAEIGRRYGITRQAVQSKERTCLRKFQTPEYLQRLKSFLYT